MTQAIIYTSKVCAPCGSLKRYLEHKGIDYTLRDIEHPKWADAVQKLTGSLIVPVTVINERVIQGLNYSGINSAIKESK